MNVSALIAGYAPRASERAARVASGAGRRRACSSTSTPPGASSVVDAPSSDRVGRRSLVRWVQQDDVERLERGRPRKRVERRERTVARMIV